MDDRRLDARARVAAGCAALSVLVVVSAALGICFGAFGVVFATSCLLDGSVGSRARRLALAALLLSAVVIVAGVIVLYRRPVGGE